MDEQTKILISIAAATAVNCEPCFEHYYAKASSVGIKKESMREAVNLANQVKKGGHLAISNKIKKILEPESVVSEDSSCKGCCA